MSGLLGPGLAASCRNCSGRAAFMATLGIQAARSKSACFSATAEELLVQGIPPAWIAAAAGNC